MLEIVDVAKRFAPDHQALDGVTLAAAAGEICCLLGPSGCGKTTLLRIIAGLEQPDRGAIIFDGEDVTAMPVHLRHFGLMFQDYALFPHMTVAQNVGFGLRMAGARPQQVQAQVDAMLDLVDLRGYARRSVDSLSGGEQQRVALARTLAPSPRLVLLDEPLANLDRLLREELAEDLRRILKRIGVTTVVVTHDQQEAFAIADRVAVMRQGHIEQDGAPMAVYQRPANAFVAGFLGFANLLPAALDAGAPGTVLSPLGRISLPAAAIIDPAAAQQRLLIRPNAAHLAEEQMHAETRSSVLAVEVAAVSFRGGVLRLQVQPETAPDHRLTFDIPLRPGDRMYQTGERVQLVLDDQAMLVVPESVR